MEGKEFLSQYPALSTLVTIFDEFLKNEYPDCFGSEARHPLLPLKRSKILHDNIWGTNKYSWRELAIIDSPLFQRLRDIHQVGLAYQVYMCARHTRFEHCLGVVTTASRIFDSLINRQKSIANIVQSLEPDDPRALILRLRQELRLAALIHDLGHCIHSHPPCPHRVPRVHSGAQDAPGCSPTHPRSHGGNSTPRRPDRCTIMEFGPDRPRPFGHSKSQIPHLMTATRAYRHPLSTLVPLTTLRSEIVELSGGRCTRRVLQNSSAGRRSRKARASLPSLLLWAAVRYTARACKQPDPARGPSGGKPALLQTWSTCSRPQFPGASSLPAAPRGWSGTGTGTPPSISRELVEQQSGGPVPFRCVCRLSRG